jgi:cation diffusion facilitator family transporter
MVTKSEASEKFYATFTSVVAAFGLTGLKVVVGVATGSLGILAEAAHSALDLVAALVTFFAVRLSDKPADERHLYGYGKVENFSALVETLLLLATCVWIIMEALERLLLKTIEIEVSVWAFLVMVVSIVIDYGRSRVLFHAARKYNSQALEADALHFSTDIWSSSVVVLGLACVWASHTYRPLVSLIHMDAIAALAVALIVVYISVKLGKRTVEGLLDTAPPGMVQQIKEKVEAVPGVNGCHDIRVRPSGPRWFIDAHVDVDGDQTLDAAHELTEKIEKAIQSIIPQSDIVVHPEPKASENKSVMEQAIKDKVESLSGVSDCHNIRLQPGSGRCFIDLHVLVDGGLPLVEAHELTEKIEQAVQTIIPTADVLVHPEPKSKKPPKA